MVIHMFTPAIRQVVIHFVTLKMKEVVMIVMTTQKSRQGND